MAPQKRKRTTATKAAAKTVQNDVKDEWDELPHNMGRVPKHSQAASTSKDTTSGPSPKKARTTRSMTAKNNVVSEVAPKLDFKVTKKSSSPPPNLEKSVSVKEEVEDDEVDTKKQAPKKTKPRSKAKQNGSKLTTTDPSEATELEAKAETDPIAAELKEEPSSKKRRTSSKKEKVITSPDVVSKAEDLIDSIEKPLKKKPKKTKDNPYGLTPGYSPFPDWPAPTPSQCQEVTTLLATMHSLPTQPIQPPLPSTTTSGCGEVPSVLDAMIRTLLSAATSGRNSSSAFQGLLTKFGTQKSGIGKGSVNWFKVREASLAEVFEAIKSGGLAKMKSKRIKEILDMVFEQNTARREGMVRELEELREGKGVVGEKEGEIGRLEGDMLSLDYFHGLGSEEAMTRLTKFPNIGVKTASCILLFCLHRPSFAVDTHVWRMCKWLSWVPPKATRDETFSHLEVRCPNDLKYPLHQLLIMHGKKCGRCRANTGEGSKAYRDEKCPVEGLVTRTGKRKGGGGEGGGGGKRGKGKKVESEEEEEEEESEGDDGEDDGEE